MTPDEVGAWDDYIRRHNETLRRMTPAEVRALVKKQEEEQESLRRRFESVAESKQLSGISGPDLFVKKPFLTAADLVMLREMKIGLAVNPPNFRIQSESEIVHPSGGTL